jgi:Transposase DDE domain group 1
MRIQLINLDRSTERLAEFTTLNRYLGDVVRFPAVNGRLADARTGKNGRHRVAGLLRQSVFGRLAGYEDVNDAERLRDDPAMRWVVGGQAIASSAASTSQMGRFETKWLSRPEMACWRRIRPIKSLCGGGAPTILIGFLRERIQPRCLSSNRSISNW